MKRARDTTATLLALLMCASGLWPQWVRAQDLLEDEDPALSRIVARTGGTLWASCAALSRQEYDEPSTALDGVFGLKSRGAVAPFPSAGYGVPAVARTEEIAVPASGPFAATTLKGFGTRATVEVADGEVLAKYADGAPAIVRHHYGKGQAFLNLFTAGLCYSGYRGTYGHVERWEHSTEARRRIITAAASAASVRPHVRIARPCVFTMVHDGPGRTVVYLVNQSGEDLRGVPLEVMLPGRAKRAWSGRAERVPFTIGRAGKGAIVGLDRAAGDVLILAFEW